MSGINFLNFYQTKIDNNVFGWFYPIDILIFYQILIESQNEISGDVCELGVAFGKSALGLSWLKKDSENLYLYDFFIGDDISEEIAQSNLEKYGNINNTEFRVTDLYKLQKSEIHFENKLRFLHIDASHEHSAVLHDINNFADYVLPNGVICLDDWNDTSFPGINTAASEFILTNKSKWKIFAIGMNKAYLCQEEYFDYYRNNLTRWMMNLSDSFNISFSEVFNKECVLLHSKDKWSNEKIEDYLENKTQRFYG